ncbi:MAG TPA: YbaK/EbsC family protein [Candidatus Competibacteraceae bacterium]|nr:YbaK/EbsC family protein [Candidatus Competibacteraceae bacterium]
MSDTLSPSARRVQQALAERGLELRVVEFPQSTRTAQQAAEAIGCQVAQIIKSLVFRARDSGRPVLVLASGANRVDERRIAALLGESLDKADAAFVRQHTGFAIGGVAPLGHVSAMVTFIDEDLLAHQELWAAAGTPNAVFPLRVADLTRIVDGRVVAVK